MPKELAGKVKVNRFHPNWVKEALVLLAEEISDSIIITDQRHGVVFWNRGAEKIFGYSAEEMIGNPVTILYPAYEKERLRDVWKQLFKGKAFRNLPVIEVTKDGKEIPLLLSLIPLRDPDGQIVRVAGIAKDITELVQQRKKVEDLTLFYEAVFDALPFIVGVLNMGGRYRAMEFANKAFLSFMETSLDKVKGKSVNKVLGLRGKEAKIFQENLTTFFQNHQVKIHDRLVGYLVFPVGQGSKVGLVMQDITDLCYV